MIVDKEHHELNNLMSSIVTYFDLKKRLDDILDEQKADISIIMESSAGVVNAVMPRILEILKGSQDEKECIMVRSYEDDFEDVACATYEDAMEYIDGYNKAADREVLYIDEEIYKLYRRKG